MAAKKSNLGENQRKAIFYLFYICKTFCSTLIFKLLFKLFSSMIQPLKYSNIYPAGNCMFKVNNRNTRKRCQICSKLTIKTPERR